MVRVALVLVVALLLLPATAFADVTPEGQKAAQVQNYLEGTEAFADHTFLLVTLNAMERDRVQVRPDQLSGYLNVPSGYQDEPMLVALTADQLLEFAKLAAALPEYADTTEVAGKSDDEMREWAAGLQLAVEEGKALREFFERGDICQSEEFAYRTWVSEADATKTIRRHYKVTSVKDGAIALTLTSEEHLNEKGEVVTGQPQSFWAWLIGGITAFFAAVASFFGFRRKTRGPVPDDAI